MPCYKKEKTTNKALQTCSHAALLAKKQMINYNWTSFYATHSKWQKGSLTVEAAVVLPLFFLGMITLICIMDFLRIQAQTSISLNESAKELGMYAYITDKVPSHIPIDQVNQAICIGYAQKKIKKEPNADIFMHRSTYQNHTIELYAAGTYKIPVSLFPIRRINFVNRARVHDWTGYSGESQGLKSEQGKQMVYITDRQTVYHTYSDCTHMERSIEQVPSHTIEGRRNESGGKYYPCPHCRTKPTDLSVVFITTNGDRFHSDQNCQSLKRTVHMVPSDEVQGMEECSRCRHRRE